MYTDRGLLCYNTACTTKSNLNHGRSNCIHPSTDLWHDGALYSFSGLSPHDPKEASLHVCMLFPSLSIQ